MDLSNKSLALLLLAAVVISLGGTLISLQKIDQLTGQQPTDQVTGKATAAGTTNLSIDAAAGCTVDTSVDFGTGAAQAATLTTDTSNPGTFNDCTDGNAVCHGMQLNNTGNTNLTVNLSSDVDGAAFLGGTATAADFQYAVRNGTFGGADGGCFDTTGTTGFLPSYADVPTTNNTICSNLRYEEGQDMITLEYNVTIDTGTPSGDKTATITFDCQQP
jgi:hypothetical protein